VAEHAMTKQSEHSLRLPPYSLEAEQSVLGGLMLDSSAWDQIVDRLNDQDFYFKEHQIIFKAMTHLSEHEKPFDVLTVKETLKSHSQLEQAGSEVYLFQIARNTPTVANITAYADIVSERSLLRRLLNVSHSIAQLVYSPQGKPSSQILDESEQLLFALAEQGKRGEGPRHIERIVGNVLDRVDELSHQDSQLTGAPTGFSDLDRMTAGLQQGELTILAGRPSMGKTALAMNISENVAVKGNGSVVVFSMEMPADSLVLRMLSSLGRIDQYKVRTGDIHDADWPRLSSAVSMLREMPFYIDDTPALNPAELRARSRRLHRQSGGLSLIIVDYLQLMQAPGYKENRSLEISEISRSLKALAKELNVPVIALSQLNRSLEQRQDRRPVMSDLRESGSIEQDADLIGFIYRDEVYHEDTPDQGIAEVIIAKQRNGPTGKVKLTFLGEYTRFESYSPENEYEGIESR
jgi:replicative DNA helicase